MLDLPSRSIIVTMSTYKKFLIALGILLVVAGLLYGLSLLLARPATPNETEQTVTKSGKLVCLPHKNPDQPHTLECAIGLHATDSKYYGLKNIPDPTTPVETEVEVTGVLRPAGANERYDITGTIDIAKLKRQ